MITRKTWRDALRNKAIQFNACEKGDTIGYKVLWYLWSADVWFGRVPLLKSIVVANVLVWALFV